MEQNRTQWLDVARGLGILFVMIGHSKLYVSSFVVYIFHMPLFFFLSGYLFSGENYDGKTFMKKKAKRLMVPYYILGIFMLIACLVKDIIESDYHILQVSLMDQLQRILEYIIQYRFGTLWYISCLFWLGGLFYLIQKKTKRNLKKMLVVSLVMLVIAIVYHLLGGRALPFNIDLCFSMMIFYFAGYAANKTKFFEREWIQKRPILWFFVFLIIALIAGIINISIAGKKVDIYWNDFCVWPLTYIGAFAGIMSISCLCQKLKSRFLEYIGKHSMLFYSMHQAVTFELMGYFLYLLNIFRGDGLFDRMAYSILCIVFSLVVWWIPTHFLKDKKIAKYIGL